MKPSRDSREGRRLLGHEYIHEARVAWESVGTDVSSITATQAVGLSHAVELTVKAGVLFDNETPAADHDLDSMWTRLPLDPKVRQLYGALVRQAALLRAGGAYPGSPGYGIITAEMDQSAWAVFRSDGQALTTIIANVGEFLDGSRPKPVEWHPAQPGPATRLRINSR